jgi:hypothetical protein
VDSDPGCTAIADKTAGAEAAAQILSEYFSAINALASFGTAKAGTEAQTLLSKTGAAVGASSDAQTALGSIAQFLVSTATAAYQEKQLSKDLPAASKNISAVIDALIVIIQDDYLKRGLASEESKLAIRYKAFGTNASPEVKLMLDDRWHTDEQAIAAKRASAQNLISALKTLSKGTSDLAANSQHLKAKELPGILEPYVTQLQTLIPQIQKGF